MTTTLERIAPFKNEAIKNFTDPADAAAMQAALARVKARFGESYPLVIGGKKIETEKKIRSINPANPDEVVGVISSASKAQALEAIEAATAAFESWKRVPMPERAAVPLQSRRAVATAPFRLRRAAHARSRQVVARSRRRHRRSDRFPRVLRARGRALRGAASRRADGRRAQRDGLHSARRRRRDSAVELCAARS